MIALGVALFLQGGIWGTFRRRFGIDLFPATTPPRRVMAQVCSESSVTIQLGNISDLGATVGAASGFWRSVAPRSPGFPVHFVTDGSGRSWDLTLPRSRATVEVGTAAGMGEAAGLSVCARWERRVEGERRMRLQRPTLRFAPVGRPDHVGDDADKEQDPENATDLTHGAFVGRRLRGVERRCSTHGGSKNSDLGRSEGFHIGFGGITRHACDEHFDEVRVLTPDDDADRSNGFLDDEAGGSGNTWLERRIARLLPGVECTKKEIAHRTQVATVEDKRDGNGTGVIAPSSGLAGEPRTSSGISSRSVPQGPSRSARRSLRRSSPPSMRS